MSKLLRHYKPGASYFVTSVSYNRMAIFVDHFDALWNAIDSVREKTGFTLLSWVVLPDHLHLILDPRSNDLSTLMQQIKLTFSYRYRKENDLYRAAVWQSRFWDHMIRDQEDLNRHIDYVHYNPVKHGFVCDPSEWKYWSFAGFVKAGYYSDDWGVTKELSFSGDFGE